MADIFEMGVVIRALDYFSGPMRSMVSTIESAQGKFAGLNGAMKMMGKSRAEIDAINASLNKMADQKAFANIASDLERTGMARQDIAAIEGSYMRMAQYQRDMAAAQAKYAAGKDLVASGTGDLMTGALGAFGIFELVKKAGEFQSNMTVIQDSTGASAKQMQAFGDAVMNASSQVSKFNDMEMSQIAQKLTSGGFSNIKQAQSLLLPVAKYAEVQMYEHKSSDLQSTQQAIEMAHIFKNYDPKSFESFLNTFNKYSMMQPGDSTQLEQTLKYLAPTAQTMGMKPDDILSLSAVANRIGLSGSHGGTNAADMILRLIPGLVGGMPTKKKTPKAWQAMEDLGFIDKNGNSQFFDKKGKVIDLNGMLSTMINDSKKMSPMQLQQKYHDIFGIQGGRAAAILADPKTMEQLGQMRAQLGKTGSMEQINKNLQNGPEGQLNKAASNSMTLMLRVGKQLAVTLTPAIVKVNKLLDSMLKFSQAHPAVNKLVGDFALFAVGGKMTEGVLKIVAGNFKMLSGAINMIKPSTMVGGFAKLKTVFSNFKNELNLVRTGFKMFGTSIKDALKIKNAAGEVTRFGKILQGTGKFFKSFGSGLLSGAKSVGKFALTLGKISGKGAIAAIKGIGGALKFLGSGSLTVIKALGRFGLTLGRLGIQALRWAIQMAADWLIAMGPVGWIIAGVTAVIGAGVAAWMTNFFGFRDKMTALWNWIKGHWKTLALAAINPVGTVIGLTLSLLPNKAKKWGMDIINGLVNGIKSMVGSVVSTVQNVAGKISGAFKHMLGIHSPSKVFAEHGKFIVQGLSMGIDQNARMATKSTADLAKGVSNSFNPNTKGSLPIAGNHGATHHYEDNSQIIFQPGSIVVNAQPGQDAKALARETFNEFGKLLRKAGYKTGKLPVTAW